MPLIRTLDDLDEPTLDEVFDRAHAYRDGGAPPSTPRCTLGLLFLEPSLRTRTGFSAAAGRLGWHVVEVDAIRESPVSTAERWEDTLRTLGGYCDVLVARPGASWRAVPDAMFGGAVVVNGGDIGEDAEHPTQALIDHFALSVLVGPVDSLRIAVVGDPRMRAVRSLMSLWRRRPPREVVLLADSSHLQDFVVPPALASRFVLGGWRDLGEVDVVYVAGIPHGSLPLHRREWLLFTRARRAVLAPECVWMSPMPVIDEMDEAVRRDGRNLMYQQSDLGLSVRMALLETLMAGASDGGEAG